jgi:peptidyl-prolyl cis-trans isomerase SurA
MRISSRLLVALFAVLASLALGLPGRCEVVDRIVAVVNDDIITMSEVQSLAKSIEAQSGGKPTKPEDREIQRKTLETLIDRKLAKAEAQKRSITVDDKEIDQAVERVKQRDHITSDEAFAKVLAGEGLTLKEVRQQIHDQIMEDRLVALTVKDKVTINEADVRRAYEAQPKDGGNQVHLRTIKLLFPAGATDAQKNEIKQKTEAILTEVKQGASFTDVARKYAVEETDVGFVSQNDLDPRLAEYLVNLKDKEVAPVFTPQGFQLIQLLSRRSGQPLSYEEAAPQIRNRLMQREMEKKFSEWVKTLREKAHIKIMM